MFSTLPKPNLNFTFTFISLSANAFDLIQSKILSFADLPVPNYNFQEHWQSPKNPLVLKSTKWARTSDFSDMVVRQDECKQIWPHNSIFLRRFLNYFSVLVIQITEQGSKVKWYATEIYASQSRNRKITGAGKWKVVIWMVPRHTLVYITDVLPMFIRNIAIITTGIFNKELLVKINPPPKIW